MKKDPEDIAKDLEEYVIAELDDADLVGVAGADGGNVNCGCGGYPFSGGDDNVNCGCSGGCDQIGA